MDRKERIYSYICQDEYIPLTFEEMLIVLDVPKEDSEQLSEILNELIFEGKIYLTKKHRYAPADSRIICTGILRCNVRGFGFVCPENGEDVYISAGKMADAIDGDYVLARITGGDRGRKEGIVERVLERRNTTISAVVDNNFGAIPDNSRIFAKIKLTDMLGAKSGDRVLIELTDYPRPGLIYAAVVSVLGNAKDLKSYTDALIFQHGIKPGFDEDALAYAEAFPETVSDHDRAGRVDFTNDMVFTIDGEDARDFDDAVSLTETENGNYTLCVHIADVSHYVAENSPLDREAFSRGTSVYLPDRVIPMLPEKLSNGLCSLNPGVLRLTLSVIMEVSPEGQVLEHKITKGVIRSKYRMTYNEVQKVFDGDMDICEKYKDAVPMLRKMYSLSKNLSKKRYARGSINFDFPETRAVLDESGYPEKIVKLERNDAHRLIEEFMLLANETVAEYAFWADIPFVFRVHEEPDSEKIEAFRRFIGNFGLFIKGREIHPKDLQQILDKIEGTPNEILIATYMLRSLMKAEYKPENTGHFGLAAKYYCHFTSPIRRYPDLMIHRILKAYICGEDVTRFSDKVLAAAKKSSETERNAELCERDADDLMKAAYMQSYIGAVFPAKVSGTTDFGIYAELENGIEGLIRLETIGGDFYEFDEESRMIIGRRHGRTYTIGDTIKIEVAGADLLTRRIDFVLAGQRLKKSTPAPKKHREYKRKGKMKNG